MNRSKVTSRLNHASRKHPRKHRGPSAHTPSLDMATSTLETDLVLPPPPPLRNHKLEGHCPLMVFGFPVGVDNLVKWADLHNMSPEKEENSRRQIAWKEIRKRLPKGWVRYGAAYIKGKATAPCLILATNKSAEELARGGEENRDLIRQYRELLQIEPGWFVAMRT